MVKSKLVKTTTNTNTNNMTTVAVSYKCQLCLATYPCKSDLQLHLQSHEGINQQIPFICQADNCGGRFQTIVQLENHVSAMHRNGNCAKTACRICAKSFLNLNLRNKHEEVHQVAAPLKRKRPPRRRHRECPVCKRVVADVKVHMRTHSGEKPYKCLVPGCGKSFATVGYRKIHQDSVHTRLPTHKCDHCERTFSRRSVMLSHAIRHFEKEFRCPACSQTFYLRTKLNNHLRTHIGEKAYNCDQCPAKFNTSSEALRHKIKHSNLGCCRYCDKKFCSEYIRQRHENAKHLGIGFVCSHKDCGKMFGTKRERIRHEVIHSSKRNLNTCSYCKKQFKQQGYLAVHLRTHTGERPFKCQFPDCEFSCTRPFILAAHKQLHITNRSRDHKCKFCPAAFHTSIGRHQHERRVHANNPRPQIDCTLCDKTFTTQSGLQFHIITTHTCERPFPCKFCAKTFTRPWTRNVHEKTHSEEDPYKCTRCGKGYRTKNGMRRHQELGELCGEPKVKRPPPIYDCEQCDKKYKSKSGYQEHVRAAHTRERPFGCTSCTKTFTRAWIRNVHEKIHVGPGSGSNSNNNSRKTNEGST